MAQSNSRVWPRLSYVPNSLDSGRGIDQSMSDHPVPRLPDTITLPAESQNLALSVDSHRVVVSFSIFFLPCTSASSIVQFSLLPRVLSASSNPQIPRPTFQPSNPKPAILNTNPQAMFRIRHPQAERTIRRWHDYWTTVQFSIQHLE